MKLLLVLPILLITTVSYGQAPAPVEENKLPVVVVSASWLHDRQAGSKAVQSATSPMHGITKDDRNFERQKRVNDPVGMRDPNADNLDVRGSELERIVQQSRESDPVDGYTYLLKIQNVSPKVIENVIWEYRFMQVGNDSNVTRRTFMCGGQIKPERQKEMNIFSLVGPSEVVSVKNLEKDASARYRAAVIINRVDYSDGTFWQRHGWDVNTYKIQPDLKAKYGNATVCRSL
ncbi:MAG TPA: hypothetical protein VHQ64_17205 [Pyrinomonadaceae bacterium]|nr:hypothetical protein [Pyrinomonadaceae bacterium]